MIYRQAVALGRRQRLIRRRLRRFRNRAVLLPAARVQRGRLRETIFVGITGSVGKTTTKRLLGAVLGSAGGVVTSQGTRNQLDGIVWTILHTRTRHRFCVAELGAGGRRPFGGMVELLRPQIGVVLNVGWDHYRRYRGPEAAAREKAALVRALPPTGVAVLNADDPLVRAMGDETQARVLLFGLAEDADIRAESVRSAWPERLQFAVVHDGTRLEVTTRLIGEHLVNVALAALATGVAAGVPLADAVAALGLVEPEPHRMSEHRLDSGVTFVQDDWKASAWAVPEALEFLGAADARRRIAIIGHLSDDPLRPRRLYARIAQQARTKADVVVLVGEWAEHGLRARSGPDDRSIMAFQTVAQADRFLDDFFEPGDLVLVKGGFKDHLARLVLARSQTVKCWRTACRRVQFCESCRLLTKPEKGMPPTDGTSRGEHLVLE